MAKIKTKSISYGNGLSIEEKNKVFTLVQKIHSDAVDVYNVDTVRTTLLLSKKIIGPLIVRIDKKNATQATITINGAYKNNTNFTYIYALEGNTLELVGYFVAELGHVALSMDGELKYHNINEGSNSSLKPFVDKKDCKVPNTLMDNPYHHTDVHALTAINKQMTESKSKILLANRNDAYESKAYVNIPNKAISIENITVVKPDKLIKCTYIADNKQTYTLLATNHNFGSVNKFEIIAIFSHETVGELYCYQDASMININGAPFADVGNVGFLIRAEKVEETTCVPIPFLAKMVNNIPYDGYMERVAFNSIVASVKLIENDVESKVLEDGTSENIEIVPVSLYDTLKFLSRNPNEPGDLTDYVSLIDEVYNTICQAIENQDGSNIVGNVVDVLKGTFGERYSYLTESNFHVSKSNNDNLDILNLNAKLAMHTLTV